VVRWGVMAQTADVTTLAIIEPLHGLTFALFHLGCMRIIADTVSRSLAGMAQAFYGTVGIGAATALSSILSGWAVRTLGTCRILGNGFAMLRSVSHHLELAHCAFTPQSLDEQVALSVTRSGAPLSTLSSLSRLERSLAYSMRMVQHYMPGWILGSLRHQNAGPVVTTRLMMQITR
jgi:MFS_1 like family